MNLYYNMNRSVIYYTKVSLLGMAYYILLSLTVVADDNVPLPPVLANVLTDKAPDVGQVSPILNGIDITATELPVQPGVNMLIPISLGHLNRFVTPFTTPQIRTTSDAQTDVQDNVLFVATDHETPISLFINDVERPNQAISVTLIPKKIPPRDVTFKLDSPIGFTAPPQHRQAKVWESSQPYVATLRDILRTLALHQLPKGYSVSQIHPNERLPVCEQANVRFLIHHGLKVQGHYFSVYIGAAKNLHTQPIELKESNCYVDNLAAVAYWPKTRLVKDETTELFIVVRHQDETVSTGMRPTLLSERQLGAQ